MARSAASPVDAILRRRPGRAKPALGRDGSKAPFSGAILQSGAASSWTGRRGTVFPCDHASGIGKRITAGTDKSGTLSRLGVGDLREHPDPGPPILRPPSKAREPESAHVSKSWTPFGFEVLAGLLHPELTRRFVLRP